MRKIDKKIQKTTTLVKKIVKKAAPKMLIKTKVAPSLIVKSKSQPKMVSKAKSVVGGQVKAKVVAKTKDKIKIPVKLSVGGKNKTKEIVAKKAITSIKIKKASLSVGPRKIEKTGSRGLASSPRDDKILQHKTKKVVKVIQKSANKVAPNKTKKVVKVIQKSVNQVVPSKTKKIIKAIKKVDKINMSHTKKPKKSDNLSPVVDKPYSSNTEEQYMNEQQITHFKKILLEWKEGLMESVDSTMHHMQDEAANYPDPVDRASQEEGFSLELRTRDRERKLLKKIDETLLRISEQDYGYCDDCGAEIGIRRLEARPTANQCIECKTIAEIREKQIGEIN